MSDYKPSSIVVSLCRKLNADTGNGSVTPIAEAIHIDGTVVIVVADGRKLTFTKDDITRTLTEENPATPADTASTKTAAVDQLEEPVRTAAGAHRREKKENHVE